MIAQARAAAGVVPQPVAEPAWPIDPSTSAFHRYGTDGTWEPVRRNRRRTRTGTETAWPARARSRPPDRFAPSLVRAVRALRRVAAADAEPRCLLPRAGLADAAGRRVAACSARPATGQACAGAGCSLYLPWLLWQVLLSGRHVAYLILHPRLPIDPKLVRYKTSFRDPAAVVIFGNSITLTPGTITAEVNRRRAGDSCHGRRRPRRACATWNRRIARVFGVTHRCGSERHDRDDPVLRSSSW